jgi:alkylhydroperoxidase family enzyme
MRIGWLTASDYEWTQHWRVAQGLGVTADDLLGARLAWLRRFRARSGDVPTVSITR